VDASRISLIGNGTAGVIGLYAAAIQSPVKKVVLENSVLSYMDIVRAKVYGGLTDLVIPGVLRDFDLPDVAKLIGPKKVVIVNPQRPNGSAMPLDEAALEYGPDVRIEMSAATASAYLQ
jgi:hypothetical protein